MSIRTYFAELRQRMFEWRINREIVKRIIPHTKQAVNHGYPFHSKSDLITARLKGNLETGLDLRLLERVALQMPPDYRDAFRYVAYRELHRHLKQFLSLAEGRMESEIGGLQLPKAHTV